MGTVGPAQGAEARGSFHTTSNYVYIVVTLCCGASSPGRPDRGRTARTPWLPRRRRALQDTGPAAARCPFTVQRAGIMTRNIIRRIISIATYYRTESSLIDRLLTPEIIYRLSLLTLKLSRPTFISFCRLRRSRPCMNPESLRPPPKALK